MARYKHIDTSPRLLAVDLERQLLPGSFAHAVHHLLDHDFDLTAAFLPPEKARFDHLGVVEYQEIARLNEIGKVGEFEVAESVWFDMQQPARGA